MEGDHASGTNEEEKEGLSQQEVTLPAALHITLAGSWPISLPAFPRALHQSGTNVTSSFPNPHRRRGCGGGGGGGWATLLPACVVPGAPGLRSDGGLVWHQAACAQRHRGQGSLTLMVLLLHSFTGVPFVLCLNVVRRRNTFNGVEVETALEP